jgi:hypothetical protein
MIAQLPPYPMVPPLHRSKTCGEYNLIIIIHLLGLAPEGWLASPDKRPMGQPIPSVPLNPLNRRTVRKPPRRKKITTQALGGRRFAARVPVDPEPTAGRKSPALLAFSSGTVGAGLSCPLSLVCAFRLVAILFAGSLVAILFALFA